MVRLSQGATGCVEIQIYDKNLQRADLSEFSVIQVLVTDVGNNVVAIFSEPALIGSYVDAPLEIQTDGILKGCFTAEMTSNSMTGRLMAEIKMIEDAPTGASPDVVIIKCIEIGSIKESFFSLGFTNDGISPNPGGGGGTTGTGTSGTSGTSGTGASGTSGTSGTGASGTSGTSGTGASGTSGTSGIGTNGTSGTSGISGTSGFLTDWALGDDIVVNSSNQIVFSGDYVLEDSLMTILSTTTEIEYARSPNKYFKKIGKVYIGGNLLLKDSTLENDGLVSVAGAVILIGNSQITGTGTII